MRRRSRCLLVSTIVAMAMSMAAPAGAIAGFGDVLPGRFYTDAVQWMVDNDITTGTSANCFSPDDPVTRGQAAAFMWRMEGLPAPGAAHPFSDVVAPWQQDPVSWMFNNDITTGTTPTTYSPDATLTRGQMAALLYRLAGSPDPGPAHPFLDVVKDWQQDAISWMFNNNITTGTTPLTFSPEDTVTRGQLAAFFHRYKNTPAAVFDPESRTCDPLFADGDDRLGLFVAPVGNPDCINIGALPPPLDTELDGFAYSCTAARNHPAGVPFFVSHGVTLFGDPADALAAGTRVEVFVDGVSQGAEEVFLNSPDTMSWRFAFRSGMFGRHTFVVEWYELGILVLRSEVDVTFA